MLVVILGLTGGCRQAAPSRAWECIAPANPGGGWDLTCRSFARVASDLGLVGGTVRVTNMPGAGGGVAYAHTVAQRNDDPALVVAASPSTTLRLAQGQYAHLTEEDVRWVAAIGAEYGILAVHRDAPWRSLGDLLATLREDPGAVVFSGGSAMAGQDHMKVMLVAHRSGIDPRRIRYVPFDGGGEAMTALLGGFVQVFSGEASEVEGQLDAGNLRILTILAPERLPGRMSDVPTAREEGVDVAWVTWRGFYIPGNVGDEDYAGWVERFERVGRSPEWDEVRRTSRLQRFLLTGPEFESFVFEQVETFREMAREIGLLR